LKVAHLEGWVGAYSLDIREVWIDQSLQKRNHRVWSKTIKCDVRKNFADSSLRVKFIERRRGPHEGANESHV